MQVKLNLDMISSHMQRMLNLPCPALVQRASLNKAAIWNRLLLLLLALELWQLKSFSAVCNSCTRSQSIYHPLTLFLHLTNSFLVILSINPELQLFSFCIIVNYLSITQRILGLHLIIDNYYVQPEISWYVGQIIYHTWSYLADLSFVG